MPKKKAPTAAQKARQKAESNFKRYVTNQLKKNPNISANEIQRNYRKLGHKIGNEKSKKIIQEKKGVGVDTKRQAASKTRIPMYGQKKNPRNAKIIKDRFQYTVQFEVIREGFVSSDTEIIIIASDRKLDRMEVEDATLAYVEDMKNSKDTEKYKTMGVVDGSIQVLYGIDKTKGVKEQVD